VGKYTPYKDYKIGKIYSNLDYTYFPNVLVTLHTAMTTMLICCRHKFNITDKHAGVAKLITQNVTL
jgi:hypothetical protein